MKAGRRWWGMVWDPEVIYLCIRILKYCIPGDRNLEELGQGIRLHESTRDHMHAAAQMWFITWSPWYQVMQQSSVYTADHRLTVQSSLKRTTLCLKLLSHWPGPLKRPTNPSCLSSLGSSISANKLWEQASTNIIPLQRQWVVKS